MNTQPNVAPNEAQEVIELGAVSVQTKGDLKRLESMGGSIPLGLAND